MTKIDTDIPDELREPLLMAALAHVPFDGWSDRILSLAAQDLNLDVGLARLAFPSGTKGMLGFLAQKQDQKMIESCPDEILSSLKIREKITLLVRKRIEAEQNIREVVQRSVTYFSLPPNSASGFKILYRTVDLMWKTIHDKSTDFNYYTKRMTLSGVYSATLLYWLNDDSEDYENTWAFLDRRINDVMCFEKTKAQVRQITAKLPDFWQNISRLRYPPEI